MQFLYFTDPMCSWCYGFGPVVHRLADTFADRAGLQVIPGGLRPDETRPISPARAAETVHHWEAVADETGRPFDRTFFDRHPGFVYDTYPASRAVTAAGRLSSGRALGYLDALQSLFYAHGKDPRDEATHIAAATAVGLDAEAFVKLVRDPATEAQTRAGFERFQAMGGMGFPLLLLETPERPRIVTIGYQSYEHLEGVVKNILGKAAPGMTIQ